MDKKQREERRRQEDRALNRGILWVGGAIVLEFILLVFKRWYTVYQLNTQEVNRALALDTLFKVVRVGGAVLAVACLAWLVFQLKKGGKTTLPTVLALVFGALAFCAHISRALAADGMGMLLLLVPGWAGLALIYYLFQREFFLSASAAGMSVVGLWFVRIYGGLTLSSVAAMVGVVLVLAVTLAAKKGKGGLPMAGVRIQVLPQETPVTLTVCTCLASLAALLLAGVLGSTGAFYLIFVMLAWLFALLVYYTVKMM